MDRELSVTIKRKNSQNKIYEVVRGECKGRRARAKQGRPSREVYEVYEERSDEGEK